MVSISTTEGLVIEGFKVVEGGKGLFVGMPSRLAKDKEGKETWKDTVYFKDKIVKEQVTKAILEEYLHSSGKEALPPNDSSKSPQKDSSKEEDSWDTWDQDYH